MKTDEYYIEMAIAEARQARNEGELPFGAVVMCNGEVISQNRCREATEKTVLAHAELHALNDACKALGRTDLSDCVIYSTNEAVLNVRRRYFSGQNSPDCDWCGAPSSSAFVTAAQIPYRAFGRRCWLSSRDRQ